MMKSCQKINLQEPQRNRNAAANFVNLIMTSTVLKKSNTKNTTVDWVLIMYAKNRKEAFKIQKKE